MTLERAFGLRHEGIRVLGAPRRALAVRLAVPLLEVGYHSSLDRALQGGHVPVARLRALRRERLGPHWREVPADTVWGAAYDFLLYSARAVVVAEIEPSDP